MHNKHQFSDYKEFKIKASNKLAVYSIQTCTLNISRKIGVLGGTSIY